MLMIPNLHMVLQEPSDLKRNLEQVSGKNLTEFFNDWFFSQGHPSYTVKWNQDNNNKALISVSQTTSHPSANYFEMPLALKFKNGSQEKIIVVNNTKNNEFFSAEIGFKADTVLIDPDYWILSRNNVSIKERCFNRAYRWFRNQCISCSHFIDYSDIIYNKSGFRRK